VDGGRFGGWTVVRTVVGHADQCDTLGTMDAIGGLAALPESPFCLITRPRHDRYDRPTSDAGYKSGSMGGTAAEIERRLEHNEWLRPGDVATLLSVSRKTVDRLIGAKRIRYRLIPGSGRHRLCNPDDVRQLLVEARKVHGGDEAGPAPEGEQGQQEEQG